MSNLRYCFVLLLANIYLINSMGSGDGLNDNEGHLQDWVLDGPACASSPDCIFPDPLDNSKPKHGRFVETAKISHGFQCLEASEDEPTAALVSYTLTIPCGMLNADTSNDYIKVYSQTDCDRRGGNCQYAGFHQSFNVGTACNDGGDRDNHDDHTIDMTPRPALVITDSPDTIYFDINIGAHDGIEIEVVIEDITITCDSGGIQALSSAKSIGTGNDLFGYEIPTNAYIKDFGTIGTFALALTVIINLMICSIYWCCTKEKWSAESAKKVMTTF